MKIATISLNIAWQDIEKNLVQAEKFILKAKTDGCDVVVLPEVFNTGFITDIGKFAEPPKGRTYQTLQNLASKNSINIVAGISEKTNNAKASNVAVVFDKSGHELAKYSKLHPFNFANEGKYFDAGDDIITFELEGTACSVFICYDLRFPEVFRQVSKDVEVIFVVANWPNSREKHWEALLIARAIENQCYVVGVNRIGKDGVGQRFNGSSMVIDPLGEVILQTNKTNEYSVCDLSLSKVAMIREKFPFLSDMRFIKTK